MTREGGPLGPTVAAAKRVTDKVNLDGWLSHTDTHSSIVIIMIRDRIP